MHQPPRRRTVPFPTGTSIAPYSPPADTANAPGLEDLDPTRPEAPGPGPKPAKAKSKVSRRLLLLVPVLALAVALPFSWSYISPVWERLPSPDFSVLQNISWARVRAHKPAPVKAVPIVPAIVIGNEPASCQEMQNRIDQMSRLVLAGVLDSGSVAAVDTSAGSPQNTCLNRVNQITAMLSDELVARHLYVLGERGELIEKTARELEKSRPNNMVQLAPKAK